MAQEQEQENSTCPCPLPPQCLAGEPVEAALSPAASLTRLATLLGVAVRRSPFPPVAVAPAPTAHAAPPAAPDAPGSCCFWFLLPLLLIMSMMLIMSFPHEA